MSCLLCRSVQRVRLLNNNQSLIFHNTSLRSFSIVKRVPVYQNHFLKCREVNIYNNQFKRNESSSSEVLGAGSFSEKIFFTLSESQAVAYVQNFLTTIHDSTGLPWWGAIALSTFLLRTAISFPLGVYQAYIRAKVENISLIEMPEIARDVKERITKKARESKWNERQASREYRIELKQEWTKLIVAQNCHPVKATLPMWFQIPTWICLSTALRNLSYMLPHNSVDAQIRYMEMSVGGFLWTPNLTVPDASWILPVFLGLSNLLIIEIQCMMQLTERTRLQRYATNFFRGFSIFLIPISATVPSSVCFYWAISSVLALVQNLILMSNRVRSSFRIPDTPSTLDHPYSHLAKEIAIKLRLTNK